MGTNYYAQIKVCPKCKRPEKELHIGKSSGGWMFLFRVNHEEYQTVAQLKKWLAKKVIRDEYGHKVSHKVFWRMVEGKQKLLKHGEYGEINIDGYYFYDQEFS